MYIGTVLGNSQSLIEFSRDSNIVFPVYSPVHMIAFEGQQLNILNKKM